MLARERKRISVAYSIIIVSRTVGGRNQLDVVKANSVNWIQCSAARWKDCNIVAHHRRMRAKAHSITIVVVVVVVIVVVVVVVIVVVVVGVVFVVVARVAATCARRSRRRTIFFTTASTTRCFGLARMSRDIYLI